jgi:proline iminopeptidase
MHDGIPSSTLQVLEDSGHFPWMEEPEPFFASVTRFLAVP